MVNQIAQKVQSIITLHESMKNSYFWSAPSNAAARRQYEQNHSDSVEFEFNGHTYSFTVDTTCSSKNIYYRSNFSVDGQKRTVAVAKKLLNQLSNQTNLQRTSS